MRFMTKAGPVRLHSGLNYFTGEHLLQHVYVNYSRTLQSQSWA